LAIFVTSLGYFVNYFIVAVEKGGAVKDFISAPLIAPTRLTTPRPQGKRGLS
jgi:hypothetical protein